MDRSAAAVMTGLWVFLMLLFGVLRWIYHPETHRGGLAVAILLRYLVSTVLIIGIGTKKFGLPLRMSSVVQMAVFLINMLADQTFLLANG